ncbi:MAG: hypothetical protein PF549_04515 [Patescibacteria group bacterium]|jgi:hypothetical protein|nr:hypothetical protein [Patescibacteria group bacterium]
MPFLEFNIDRAIIKAQYALRGAYSDGGVFNDKAFHSIPFNLIFSAIGGKHNKGSTDDTYVRDDDSAFEMHLKMCKKFASDCDKYQKEAIKIIIHKILKDNAERREVAKKFNSKPSFYLCPPKKDNDWGKIVLSLAEAFEVSIKSYLR